MPLLDPLCGSGTIPIEAALIARDIAPGLAVAGRSPRTFRFLDWPDAGTSGWDELVEQATSRIRSRATAPIVASDRNAGAIRAAVDNARRAGVSDDIEFATRPLSAVRPPAAAGWIITNPPWGRRIGSRAESHAVLRDLERRMDTDFVGWSLAALAPGPAAGRARSALVTRHGGIPVRLRVAGPLHR